MARRGLLFFALMCGVVLFFLSFSETYAAVTIGNSTSATRRNASSVTFSHTVAAGTNRLLVVGISCYNCDSSGSISTVRYGGRSLTRAGTVESADHDRSEIWYLKDSPTTMPTGANNVVVNFNSSVNAVVGATSWEGVDQTNSVTFTSANGHSKTPSIVVSSAAGEAIQDSLSLINVSSLAVGGGQNQLWNATTGGSTSSDQRGASSTEPGASSVTMSWTVTNSSTPDWALAVVRIKPAAAAGGTSTVNFGLNPEAPNCNPDTYSVGGNGSVSINPAPCNPNIPTPTVTWGTPVTPTLPAGQTATPTPTGPTPTPSTCSISLSATASNTYPGFPASNVVDDSDATWWNSGGYPTQWIQVNLGTLATVTGLKLLPLQTPNGPTVHNIYAGATPATLSLVKTISQFTSDWEAVNVVFSPALTNVQYIKVETTSSPSWVGWYDVIPIAVCSGGGGVCGSVAPNGFSATYSAPGNVCNVCSVPYTAVNDAGSSNGSVDVKVMPVLSGTVYKDTGGSNGCGGSVYTDSATLKINDDTDSVTSAANGTYTITEADTCGNKSVTISNVTGYRVKQVRINGGSWTDYTNFTYSPVGLSGNQTLDWCVSNIFPWIQTTTGDVRFKQIPYSIPSGQSASSDSSNPSTFISSGTFPWQVGSGTVSPGSDKWKINDEYSYNDGAQNANGGASYSFYKSRAAQKNVTLQRLAGCPAGAGDCTITAATSIPTGVYSVDGNLTINGYTQIAGAHVLILVSGTTTINNDITLPTNAANLLILASKGAMTISASGVSGASQNIGGIFTSEANIIADGTLCSGGSNPDKVLNVQGSVVANSRKPFSVTGTGSFVNNRSLCNGDQTTPSITVTPRLDFVIQLTDFYKTSLTRFREVNP